MNSDIESTGQVDTDPSIITNNNRANPDLSIGRRVLRFAVQQPWPSAVVAMFVAVVTASMFGMPVWLAWCCLIYGFALLGLVGAVANYFWQPKVAKVDTIAPDAAALPMPDTGPSDAKSEQVNEGRWSWASVVFGLFLIVATATLFGLATWLAWWVFAIGLSLVVVTRVVVVCRKRVGSGKLQTATSDSPEPTKEKQSEWGCGWTILAMIIVAGNIARNHNDARRYDEPWNSPRIYVPAVSPVQRGIGVNTSKFWQVAVAGLHQYRFIAPTGDEPASQYYERLFTNLLAAVDRANALPTQNVDTELVAMVKRHLDLDDDILAAVSHVWTMMEEQGIPKDLTPIGEQFDTTRKVFADLAIDESAFWQNADEESRRLIASLIELEERRLEQLREIEIMQATLKERYKGQPFALPEFGDEF